MQPSLLTQYPRVTSYDSGGRIISGRTQKEWIFHWFAPHFSPAHPRGAARIITDAATP
jgi:hypothetical protein